MTNNFKDIQTEKFAKTVTMEKGHGRIEIRKYYQITDIDWLANKEKCKNLNSIEMVIRKQLKMKKKV